MELNKILQLYPQQYIDYKQQMSVEPENISMQHETLKVPELRLLSLNRVSKMLGIRYATVLKLVRTGRIKAITINNKYKIPYINLVEFVNGSNNNPAIKQATPIENTQNRIDNLLKEYAD